MRAATALVPLLQAAGNGALPHLWRGDEWSPADARADCTPSGHAGLDQELPGQGWPHGQLVELLLEHSGIGELSLLLPALATATRSGRTCVWVLPCQADAPQGQRPAVPGPRQAAALSATPALPYAPALVEAGVDLARNIFVKPLTVRESGWALEQSLRAAHLGVLLGWLPEGAGADADFRSLRRLHLLAQRNRALVFILRNARHAAAPSPAALRLQLHHDGQHLQVQVLKRRGRPLLDPVALQIHPAHWNRGKTPAPSPVQMPAPATAAARARPEAAPGRSTMPQIFRALSPGAGRMLHPLLTAG
jgi:hypothetical protein